MKAINYTKTPDFDDIIFEKRNREYGAYQLRRKYHRNVLIGLLTGILTMCAAVIAPFLAAKADHTVIRVIESPGPIILEDIDNLIDKVTPPPPPAPEPSGKKQLVYMAPEIVDSLKADESSLIMITDDIKTLIKDLKVIEIVRVDSAGSEITDVNPADEIFVSVEEMPMFPGGDQALLKYIAENTVYPEVPRQNNIQGRVVVKFCVTPHGGIDKVTILKGVDPELDAEAIRVVKTFPHFIPGKQNGKPVSVWYTAQINFRLQY